MKDGIVANGYDRLKRAQEEMTPEAMAKKRETIEKKYKQLIAAAKPQEKEQICERLAGELSRLYNYEPSAAALWVR